MSAALLKEVLADKEALAQAQEEAGLIIARVFSDTFRERQRVEPTQAPRLVVVEKRDDRAAGICISIERIVLQRNPVADPGRRV